MDKLRVEWFNDCMRFARECDVCDRASIWDSWCAWCADGGHAVGSRGAMWKWLLMIGAKQHPICWYAFLRVKLKC